MSKNLIRKYSLVLVTLIIAAAFQSLSLKADIGVAASWDSISLNVYQIFGIKVGYTSITLNSLMVLLQLIVLGKNFDPIRLLEIPTVVVYGVAVNFFYYDVFTFEPASYIMRLLILVISFTGLACSLSITTIVNFINLPLEGTCYLLEETKNIPFRVSRVAIDIFSIASSLGLSLIYGSGLKIREGTLIGVLILGPLMNICIGFYKRLHLFEF